MAEWKIKFQDNGENEDSENNEESELDNQVLTIDHYAVNIIAKRILKKHGIHPNFPLNYNPMFIP